MMRRRFPIWPAFDMGEISPLVGGRVDGRGWYRSCESILNFINRVQGPLERRAGSYHRGMAYSNSYASHMVPFRYSAEVSFVLELSHQKMRFFTLGSRIVESELITNGDMELDASWSDYGSPSTNERSSEQTYEGTYSRKVVSAFSGDGIQGATFTTTAGTNIASMHIYSATLQTINIKVRKGDDSGWAYEQTFTLQPGVFTWVHFTYDETAAGSGAYIAILATAASQTFYVDYVTLRKIYEITTPWNASELAELKYKQTGNTVYFTHPDYWPRKLVRSATTSWALSEMPLAWGPFLDENETDTTLTPGATTGTGISLYASAALFDSGHVGAQFKLTDDIVQEDVFSAVGNGTAVTMDEAETFIFSLSGTWVGTMTLQRQYPGGSWVDYLSYTVNVSVEMTNLEANTQWRWAMTARTSGTCTARITRPNKSGYVKIATVTDSQNATCDVIETLPSTDATTKWSEGAFSDYRGFPKCHTFYEGRHVPAGTEHQPSTVYGSEVDDYESHETGDTDDKAYNYTLSGAEINQIQWMVDGDILHIGTTGDEWRFGDSNDPTTPTSVKAKRQSGYGSANIDALRIGDRVLFVEDGASSLRAIRYEWERDAYVAEHISEKSEHLFKDASISGMCFSSRPVPVLWIWLDDGTMVSCTLETNKGMAAFNRMELAGAFVESACVIRGSKYDEVWFSCRRTVDGSTVRHIESISWPQWTDKEDAFYVDAGLTYAFSADQGYITGLYHLEGEEVAILADGAIHAPETVTNGAIALDYDACIIQIGLAYQSLVIPSRLELPMQGGDTSQSRKKQTQQVVLRLYNAIGFKIGKDADHLVQHSFRTTQTPLGSAPDLFSGDVKPKPMAGATDQVCVECSDPGPITVVAIMPITEVTEDY